MGVSSVPRPRARVPGNIRAWGAALGDRSRHCSMAQRTASGMATRRKLVWPQTVFALDLLALQSAAPSRVDDHEVFLVTVPGQAKQFAGPQGAKAGDQKD